MTPDNRFSSQFGSGGSLPGLFPYSKFRVGAALRCRTGAMFSGCNVENASYGLTICAERNAVFQMIAAGEREVETIVIYTPTPTPTAPCGACRQVLNEFNPDIEVVSVCDGPDEVRCTLRELLPGVWARKPCITTRRSDSHQLLRHEAGWPNRPSGSLFDSSHDNLMRQFLDIPSHVLAMRGDPR